MSGLNRVTFVGEASTVSGQSAIIEVADTNKETGEVRKLTFFVIAKPEQMEKLTEGDRFLIAGQFVPDSKGEAPNIDGVPTHVVFASLVVPEGADYFNYIAWGNLGYDPKGGTTDDGKPYANFSVATMSNWLQEGEWREATLWNKSVVFGNRAKAVIEYMRKGMSVLVEAYWLTANEEGDPKTYEDKDGNTRAPYNFIASKFNFPTKKGSGSDRGPNASPADAGFGSWGGSDVGTGPDAEIPF